LDSVIKIPDLISRCRETGMKAVAITDHGVAAASVQLYTEALKKEDKEGNPVTPVKPLIGMEAYMSPTDDHTLREKVNNTPYYHLTLLAKNAAGVSQIYKLSSIGFFEGFYYKPRVSLKLVEEIGKDLIVMGGCVRGPVSWNVHKDNINSARNFLSRLKDSFKDDFYIEVMDHGLDWQEPLNKGLIALCQDYNVQWVPTNDAHFLAREDHYIHSIMMALQLKKTMKELQSSSMYYSEECYMKTPEEMWARWGPQCNKTMEIAEKVNIQLELNKPQFPEYKE
jgi:DNA polymerase-3 subunit alpha